MYVVSRSLALVLVLSLVFAGLAKPAAAAAPVCLSFWRVNFSIELRPGYWTLGSHTWEMRGFVADEAFYIGPNHFTVSSTAPLYAGQVFLRVFPHPLSIDGPANEIRPEQDTLFQVSFAFLTHREAQSLTEAVSVQFRWDGGEWVDPTRGPVAPNCMPRTARFMRSYGPSFD